VSFRRNFGVGPLKFIRGLVTLSGLYPVSPPRDFHSEGTSVSSGSPVVGSMDVNLGPDRRSTKPACTEGSAPQSENRPYVSPLAVDAVGDTDLVRNDSDLCALELLSDSSFT